MKNIIITAGLTVIFSLSFSSCGKKAEDHKAGSAENIINDNIEAALAEETHKELQAAIIAGDVSKFKSILDTKKQVDLNKILADGETLITTAVIHDQQQILQLLFNNNASIFRTNDKKENPLMVAARLGNEAMVRILVTLGAKTDTKDANGNTPLHLAILSQHEAIALYLINLRINYDITNNDDKTPLQLAQMLQMDNVVSLLRSLIQQSVSLPDRAAVRSIFTLGSFDNINELILRYPTILTEYVDLNFFALIFNSHPHDDALSIANLLLKKGVNIQGPANAETTPLIEAIKKNTDVNYEDIVALILSNKVNPNIQDASGKTALIWAIKVNSAPITKSLLDNLALEKYTYYVNGKKKTMKACDEARTVKKDLKTTEAKKANEDIMDYLGCGLRWLF